MPKLIDADTVVTIQVYDDMTEEWDLKKMTIEEAIDKWSDEGCPSTVDAVEVVRCKDCKHYKEYDGEIECWARPMLFPREPDDYCSMGERREKCRD